MGHVFGGFLGIGRLGLGPFHGGAIGSSGGEYMGSRGGRYMGGGGGEYIGGGGGKYMGGGGCSCGGKACNPIGSTKFTGFPST